MALLEEMTHRAPFRRLSAARNMTSPASNKRESRKIWSPGKELDLGKSHHGGKLSIIREADQAHIF